MGFSLFLLSPLSNSELLFIKFSQGSVKKAESILGTSSVGEGKVPSPYPSGFFGWATNEMDVKRETSCFNYTHTHGCPTKCGIREGSDGRS